MKNEIIKIAKSLGIEEIGFSSAVSMPYLKPLLEKRIEKSYQSEFEENNPEKRINADIVLENCQSIICAVFPYAKGYHIPKMDGMGNLSISSYGMDYHKIVNEKLERLATEIQSIREFNYKICVDTSPLLDRAVCKSAGLGFIGKNNMLINDRYGSFTFLGYILADINLDNEDSVDVYNNEASKTINDCGECNICVKMCPNHAILGDGTINAKRCVSYLTQTKSYIDISYRRAMGHQIYGCDVCQYYCPKNKHVIEETTDNNYDELLVDLKEIMNMTNKEFKSKYGHVAGSWRGRAVWKRNAIIASANMKLMDMYELIVKELYSDNEMIKLYAIWALMEMDREKSIKIINNIIETESELLQNEYKKLLGINTCTSN